MERFLWKGCIYPGKLNEYIDKHNNICQQMTDMMEKAGMRNYTIWNNGREVIGYYEYDNLDRKKAVYAEHNELIKRWNKSMQGVMEMEKDENGNVLVYRQVFLKE